MTRIRSRTTAKILVESTNEIIEVNDSLLDWEPVPVEEVGGAGREYWAECVHRTMWNTDSGHVERTLEVGGGMGDPVER